MKLRELGEFGLIDRIAAAVHGDPAVQLGIGDDAAVLAPSPGTVSLVTSDMLVEGIHFDLSFCPARSLGRKSLAVNVSDLAAMGARPRFFLLSLALPPSISLEFLDEFTAGLLEEARRHRISLVGGDTCASPAGLTISITAIGEQAPERVVTRRGARPGDLVFVSGTVGDSALGLTLLRQGVQAGTPVRRHLEPEPRLATGVALAEAGDVTAMIDISDGLLADLGHILRGSAAGAVIDCRRLPLSPEYEAAATSAGDRYELALTGGEDYELLFTAPEKAEAAIAAIAAATGTPLTIIGEITPGSGVTLAGSTGTYRSRGYDHFRR